MNVHPHAPGRLRATLACLAATAVFASACASGATSQQGSERASAGRPAAAAQPAGPTAAELIKHRVYTRQIRNQAEFDAYSEQVADERFTKLIIDVRTGEVYYFDVNVYAVHTDFVFSEIYREPQSPERLADFLANYDEDKPEFMLLYLVHHITQDLWTFAFWEGDRMRPEHIREAHQRLGETFFDADKLHFRPDSMWHREVAAKVRETVPVITNEEVYQQTTYQLFNEGARVGVLRIIENIPDDELVRLTYKPEEIIVVAEALPTLTVVSGIIAEEFSTPLSHLGLRARAWGIPHVGLKNAAQVFRPLAGEVVFFEASQHGYSLREASAAEIAAWKAQSQRKREVQIPPADLEREDLASLDELRAGDSSAYGAKAANLGEIVRARLKGFEVPAGLAIPIRYYLQHMEHHGLQVQAMALLTDDRFQEDGDRRREALEALRAAIVERPIDDALLDAVIARAKALGLWGPEQGLFVRSSTNAEDLPGFNGAGLYDTVPNVLGRAALGRAIKEVWASVWNLRAFEERQFYGIDHRAVYGAVLVQRGVNATAAGVLITTNIYDREDTTTYTINAKTGLGMRVVEGRRVPEQILFDYAKRHVRVLSRSDEDTMLVFDGQGGVKEVAVADKGQPVLTDERAERLVDAARKVARVFPPDSAQDIEWLFEGETLHIVQCRPYVSE